MRQETPAALGLLIAPTPLVRHADRFDSVVIVGTDAPLLGRDRIDEAHGVLASGRDLVLIPDGGGGYSLIGVRTVDFAKVSDRFAALWRGGPSAGSESGSATAALPLASGGPSMKAPMHARVDRSTDSTRMRAEDPSAADRRGEWRTLVVAAERVGLNLELLRPCDDVDTADDLWSLAGELARRDPAAPDDPTRTRAFLNALPAELLSSKS